LSDGFYQVTDGERILITLGKIGSDRCCDCGLTHKVIYVLASDPSSGKQVLIQRSFRDEKSTAKVRRAEHVTVKRRK